MKRRTDLKDHYEKHLNRFFTIELDCVKTHLQGCKSYTLSIGREKVM